MGLRRLATSATLAAALAGAAPASAGAGGWDDAGSIARDALVVAAIGAPVVQGDWAGAMQAGGSIGATALVTTGLKQAFPAWRPDRSDRKSFPSGHASMAFAAAATLHNRYGWEAGLPAQLVAAFVGFSRVKADKHHWYDVVAGAAIGEAAGFLITRRRDARVRILPWGDSKGGGMAMAMRF